MSLCKLLQIKQLRQPKCYPGVHAWDAKATKQILSPFRGFRKQSP